MRYSAPSALTPFLRSDLTGAVLAEVMLHDGFGLSLSEIARRVGGVYSAVHREATRLVDAEIFTSRSDGRNRLISANVDHPLHRPLVEILTWTYGPEPTLRNLVESTGGADFAAIYGSWAARRMGEPGPRPADIDLLLVGQIARRDAARLGATASETLNTQVNVTVLRPQEWETDTPFTQSVKARPMVPLL